MSQVLYDITNSCVVVAFVIEVSSHRKFSDIKHVYHIKIVENILLFMYISLEFLMQCA